ncbi:MAG: DUF4430 domain-containing protein [Nitrososphaeria archaeon]|jgi:hypothetical protein
MSQHERILTIGLIVFLLVSMITAATTIYYHQEYVTMKRQYNEELAKLGVVSYTVNILLDNNGTKTWYNQTLIPIGWSLYNATVKVTNGNVNYSSVYGPSFITAINGVSSTVSYYWIWWVWNSASHSWTLGSVGADAYSLKNNDIVAWYFENTKNLPSP